MTSKSKPLIWTGPLRVSGICIKFQFLINCTIVFLVCSLFSLVGKILDPPLKKKKSLIYSIGPHRFFRIPHPSCLTFSVDWHIIRVISFWKTSSGLNPLVFQLIDRQFLISYGETSSRLSVFQILSHKVRGMLPGRQIIQSGSGEAPEAVYSAPPIL